MSLIDKLAKKVQDYSGESERRNLVEEFKLMLETHIGKVNLKVDKLNSLIGQYNKLVNKLNLFREQRLVRDLVLLHDFLGLFGDIKRRNQYMDEKFKTEFNLPEQAFKKEEDYLEEIDLSKQQIFHDSFKKGLIGTKKANRQNSLKMNEFLGEYKISMDAQINHLVIEIDNASTQNEIANLYMNTVEHISKVIEDKIIPELELAQAFLEAEEIKNYLISNLEIPQEISQYNIQLLENTRYDHHYRFVKNTFLYYIMSEKIYSTPVLTKLMNNQTTDRDLYYLEQQNILLSSQEEVLEPIYVSSKKGADKYEFN